MWHGLTGPGSPVGEDLCLLAGVEFEKWQALGNDYLIVEQRSLPFELTPLRVQRICSSHTGVCADGILLLSEPDEPG